MHQMSREFNPDIVSYLLKDADINLNIRVYNSLASTSQALWNAIAQGASLETVVIALQQTAGKGQWGRQWSSSLGGLYLSLALAPNLPAAHSSYLTVCSAWGIATQLRNFQIPVWLKWPNDLILNQHKLGGILTETRIQQNIITKAVVGVGINWTNPVPEVGINLQDFLTQFDSLEKLAAITIQGILLGYNYCHPIKFKTIIPAYKQLLTSDTYKDTTVESDLFFQQLEL
jgi:BirA family transcriptional regulator, biotin operon repressor / biotin---[acetyl-CoA-carboxylase] ligase